MPRCKQDEILNPKTNRCVKKTGKIGTELLKQQQRKAAMEKAKSTTSLYIPAYLRAAVQARKRATVEEVAPPRLPQKCSFRKIVTTILPEEDKLVVRLVSNVARLLIHDAVWMTAIAKKKVLRKRDLETNLEFLLPGSLPTPTHTEHKKEIEDMVEVCMEKSAQEHSVGLEKPAKVLMADTVHALFHSWKGSSHEAFAQEVYKLSGSITDKDVLSHLIMKYA